MENYFDVGTIPDLIKKKVGIIDPKEKEDAEMATEPMKKEQPIFPFDALPEWLQDVVAECGKSYGTPPEVWAMAFLSGISAASGKRFNLINQNYTNYPQLWLMVVGASGTGKSDPFRIAFEPLKQCDDDAFLEYREKIKEWEACGKQGEKPRWEQLLINDTTPEALYAALQYAESGLTLYRDELSGFFDDIGRYNRSGEIGHYLSIFSNDTFSVNRKNDEPLLIRKPLLNIVGTVQPGVLEGIFSKNNAETSGFMQRFLFLFPDFPERGYNPEPISPEILQNYYNLIQSILSVTDTGETKLSSEAEKRYAEYFRQCEKNRVRSDDFWASVYSKAEIQALRLALLIKIARLPEVPTNYVETEDMECAIGITDFCISSLKKFKGKCVTKKRTSDVIRDIYEVKPDASPTIIGELFGVSKQYAHKLRKVDGLTVDNASNHLQ